MLTPFVFLVCLKEFGRGENLQRPTETTLTWLHLLRNASTSCPGTVMSWTYYAAKPDIPVYLGIWRRFLSPQGDRYTMVGRTVSQADAEGWTSVHLRATERIHVQAGDFIGVHYGKIDGNPSASVIPSAYVGQVSKRQILQIHVHLYMYNK